MGYCTNYSLTVVSGDDFTTDHKKAIGEHSGHANPFDGACKWDDHEDDMLSYSKDHPLVLFLLEGEGEESGDLWRKWFKNGQMQESFAKIVFDEFDPSLFDTPEPELVTFYGIFKKNSDVVIRGREIENACEGYVTILAFTEKNALNAFNKTFSGKVDKVVTEKEINFKKFPKGNLLEIDATLN